MRTAHSSASLQGGSSRKPAKTLVLVGLMGAGKSCIGKRLAQHFGLAFVDADLEIERAAGCKISEIFERHGEAHFRDGERRVIARLLDQPLQVLATGGGAFMDPRTREKIRACGISIWLRADLELLLRRTARRTNRPLLNNGDRRATLARLMEARYPVYAAADIVVDSNDAPPELTVERVIAALERFLVDEEALSPDKVREPAP
ncbi:MAG TPA: shikimate kinase [Alphaproteobacteria bacterium]|nr:shikimate kinase [Alphaproteobacteria bacterium]